MKKNRIGSVYVIHNHENDKEYVGQTIRDPEVRFAEHIHAAFVTKSNKPLYRAMRKAYKRDGDLRSFTAEVIWQCPEAKLNASEKRYVRQRRTFIDTGWGYNLTTGGDCFRLSRQSIRKIRKTLTQYYTDHPDRRVVIGAQSRIRMSDPGVIQKLSSAAKKQFDVRTRKMMSRLKQRQYKKDPAIRKKLSQAATLQWASASSRSEKSKVSKEGWTRREGEARKASNSARQNMSAAQYKRFSDPLECKKISDGQNKRYEAPEAHKKSSDAQYARFVKKPVSSETKAKISEATRRNWAENAEFRATMLADRRDRPRRTKLQMQA